MNPDSLRVIELTEYTPRLLAPAEISEAEAELLWRNYGSQVAVEAPSFKTEGRWRLVAQGWVGYIPLTPTLHLALSPKVEPGNLFRMLEYAYRLASFRFLEGLVRCRSLVEFYERLAALLARRVLERTRKGLYHAYLTHTDRLPYVRGRLELDRFGARPGQVQLPCRYEEHTADIEDNQILAWTLAQIVRSGIGSERMLPVVRRACRALQGAVTLQPYPAAACRDRVYNRLNQDYQSMHALCRFFLEQRGPAHQWGDREMLPFMVDMAHLYERFVTEWLRSHLPSGFSLKAQERVDISVSKQLYFALDLVLYEAGSDRPRYILDTKYKTPDRAAERDIQQMISYAHARGCSEAVLVYPAALAEPLDETIRGIRLRSLAFRLEPDLEQAGQSFCRDLFHE